MQGQHTESAILKKKKKAVVIHAFLLDLQMTEVVPFENPLTVCGVSDSYTVNGFIFLLLGGNAAGDMARPSLAALNPGSVFSSREIGTATARHSTITCWTLLTRDPPPDAHACATLHSLQPGVAGVMQHQSTIARERIWKTHVILHGNLLPYWNPCGFRLGLVMEVLNFLQVLTFTGALLEDQRPLFQGALEKWPRCISPSNHALSTWAALQPM
nr:uncharacterized protein LOC116816427 [Chelonoidis abingdonii]